MLCSVSHSIPDISLGVFGAFNKISIFHVLSESLTVPKKTFQVLI